MNHFRFSVLIPLLIICQSVWAAQQHEKEVQDELAPTHIEIKPLPVKFSEIKSIRLRSDGNLLAADRKENVIKVISPDGKILKSITPEVRPEILALDDKGYIYCGGEGKIVKMDAEGKTLKLTTLPNAAMQGPVRRGGSRPPGFSGLTVSDDAVYATFGSGWSTSSKARMYRFTLDLEEHKLLAEGLRGCCQHCDVLFHDGKLYLAENAAYRVVQYDPEGAVVQKWGSKSRDDVKLFGGCCNPMNLDFDSKGVLYTAESGLGRVKRYTTDGQFLGIVGYLDVAQFTRGSTFASMCCYIPIAVTPDGKRVYVTDVKENIIRVLQQKAK